MFIAIFAFIVFVAGICSYDVVDVVAFVDVVVVAVVDGGAFLN